ncbi:MAG TPA: HD-GYP domain-containing protein [Usitatibacter sp.]|jgi:HD-GYP domain-containing protein (c-di-GMP phosphodiesterase class II)|nr:HD-GYP domain-containing protein [Usitatibacter sp.]
MAMKIPTTELKVGMFVADLDRPWVDTPFLLQGFLIEEEEQIRALVQHCHYVMVDRSRSTGDEYEAPVLTRTVPPEGSRLAGAAASTQPGSARPSSGAQDLPPGAAAAPRRASSSSAGSAAMRWPYAGHGHAGAGGAGGEGLLGRLASGFKGLWHKERKAARPRVEPPKETPQEFEARAALAPPGVAITTYVDQVSVEDEVPRAQQVVARTNELLEKLVNDIRLGGSFEIEAVQEVVDEMVESIVRNPDALMWVARLREQDIGAYGHGLQVSVYLTAFGRHLGFPRSLLASLAQVGLLLDVGKIRLPRQLLDKQGRLAPEEFDQVKAHVQHSLDILSETPNFDAEVLQGVAQHHERMNGSGYPNGLVGDEIGVTGRMAGIVDCFAALINHRPYAAAVSSYEALRSITGWGGDYFHEPLVQQFVSSVGVFPVGSLIELSSGEVAIVVAHNKLRRLKPRVLVVTGPDKQKLPHPAMVDLLYDPRVGDAENVFIKRGLAAGAYGLDLGDFYLSASD